MAAGNSGGFSMMKTLSTKKSQRDRNMGKLSRVSRTTEVMKPYIWKRFPEDLFEVVLARLPIATIIRFRIVCKQWNNLITSQSFSQHCAQVSQANPWFYITFGNKNNEAMYDPFMKKWYYPNTFNNTTFQVSSAGGLVCFEERRDYESNLYVCNPMTQSFKKLPNGSIKKGFRTGMAMNWRADYMVLKLGNGREYEIYDSVTKCWSHIGKIPECIKVLGIIISNPVSIDNTLYFKRKYPEGIVSYDMSTGVWTQNLIQVPLHSPGVRLAESDGRIMHVGLVTENDVTCLCIWEMQKMTFLLKEVDRVPCLEFNGRPLELLTCLGNKGLFWCYLRSRDMYHMITYNISTRKWVKNHVPNGRKLQNYWLCTAFQPCLTAMP